MQFIRIQIIVVVLAGISLSLSSQPMTREQFRKDFLNAENLIEDGNFQEALLIYRSLLKEEPDNANLNFKIGYCYLNTVLEKESAVTYLEKAILNIDPDAMPEEPDELSAPEEALLFLAQAYHQSYKFSKAIEMIERLKNQVPDYKMEFTENIDQLEKYCKNGEKLINYPVKMHVTNLGGTINTEFDEHSPVFSADESVLIFTSKRFNGVDKKMTPDGQFHEDIYISNRLPDGQWSDPKGISPSINTLGHEASIGLSVDGSQLFIYKDDGGSDGNIYYSKLNGEQWTVPVKMGGEINTKYIETHASLSADGNELYFTSNRPGGMGGLDVYVVKRLPNGEWSSAQNLGPNINTEFDEEGPFIHPDGVTLFFSSKGHMSMGDFDIFFSIKDEDRNWGEATNIGYPINTPNDDVFYMPTPDGRRAYYASHQTGGIGRNDIYLISLPGSEEKALTVMSGVITLADGNPPQNVTITVTDIDTKDLVGVYTPNSKTGKYLFILKSGKNYNVTIEADDFMPFSENLMVKDGTSYQEIQRPIFLDPIILGSLKKEYTFRFVPNSSEMDPQHLTEIPLIAKLMKILPDHNVQIILPEKSVSENINSIRADIISENLQDRGVSQSRIKVLKQPVDKEKNIIIYISGDELIFADQQVKKDTVNTQSTDNSTKKDNPAENTVKIGDETIEGYVLFGFDKFTTNEYNENLNKVSSFLAGNPTVSVVLTGHTDLQGKFKYNMKLSKKRADFVKQYLMSKGVRKEQIFVQYKGESMPIAKEDTPQSRKYNRRVEILFNTTAVKQMKVEQLEIPSEFKL
ncbi:MAG: hypothetical protein CVU05_09820 [Bacteroidetes bacterium HGW-Bacteroidetes-21]|jgi:outer membrane protein OmpA-like peptidoglycan-associated protein|nr:MAG: hypothetical protein CVU05_09820 [Bacteroidetes bacterium HGW-Bacteroidetes-21]